MMESDFHVTSTWAPDRAAIQDIFTFGDAQDPQQKSYIEGEIIHVINEDQFVYLKRPADDVPCILSVDFTESSYEITKISVVSEGRIVEVYGRHGEYLATSHGLLLDRREGRSFFNSQIHLTLSSRHHLSIKFLGMKDDDEGLWVFGIKLVQSRRSLPPGSAVFDFSAIESKLAASKLPITTRADKLKQFMQYYTSKKADPYTLMKMVEADFRTNLRPVGDVGKNISSLMQSILLKGSRTEEERRKGDEEGTEEGKEDMERRLVEERLKQMERRLEEKFQRRLEMVECRQNQKLEELECRQHLDEPEDRLNLELRETFQKRLEILEKSFQRRLEDLEKRQNQKLEELGARQREMLERIVALQSGGERLNGIFPVLK